MSDLERWSYWTSIEKFKNLYREVRAKGADALIELKTAHEQLTCDSKKKKTRQWPDKTFETYCQDIGISKTTAYRWLERHFPDYYQKQIGIVTDETIPEESLLEILGPAMEYHQIAGIFPMMNSNEFNCLKESIQKLGLLQPITTYEGKILDGRCRYEACRELGIEPEYEEFDSIRSRMGYRGSPLDYVISANMYRGHYSEDQRAVIAVNAIPFFHENGGG